MRQCPRPELVSVILLEGWMHEQIRGLQRKRDCPLGEDSTVEHYKARESEHTAG